MRTVKINIGKGYDRTTTTIPETLKMLVEVNGDSIQEVMDIVYLGNYREFEADYSLSNFVTHELLMHIAKPSLVRKYWELESDRFNLDS